MKLLTINEFEKWKLYVLHFSNTFHISFKIWWQKHYDGYTGIKFSNWRKKEQYHSWRGKQCLWTFYFEIRNFKLFICRIII